MYTARAVYLGFDASVLKVFLLLNHRCRHNITEAYDLIDDMVTQRHVGTGSKVFYKEVSSSLRITMM